MPTCRSLIASQTMTIPLLPAIDAAGQLREAGFALLLHYRRPLELTELAEATGVDLEGVRSAVAALATAGWLDLDDTGRVAGAAGLSLTTGPHGLTLGEASFRTWCAYDALGIAAALEADGHIETTCGWCQAPISVAMHGGAPGRTGPEWLWLAEGGDDLRGSFCTPTVLLCGEEHAVAWAEAQGRRGRKLDLAEGARQGAADWRGCAEASRQLA